MKKMIAMVAVALMAVMSANAQSEDLQNELSLSYGVGSTSQLGDGIGEGFFLALFSDTELDDGFILGPISVEYFRHLNNPRLAIGGFVSYSKWNSDIVKRSGYHEKVGERKRNFIAVMPAVKWYWTNKNSFGFYSKVAAGAAFLNSSEKDSSGQTKDDNGTYFMFQLSPVGLEFGKQFRFYTELGVGEQGFIQAGLRYKF